MTQYDETHMSPLTFKQHEQQRQAVGQVRYSPWWLAVSTTLALALFLMAVAAGAAAGIYFRIGPDWEFFGVQFGGLGIAFLVGLVMAPIPSAVVWWCWKAFGVELKRLSNEPTLFTAPAAPTQEEDDDPTTQPAETNVELMPGYELNGELVAPVIDSAPEVAELRRKCLALVHAGMKRGGWSRSKVAEGPSKQMKGADWDDASRELQRLGYFANGPSGLAPAKDLADIIRRLELAR